MLKEKEFVELLLLSMKNVKAFFYSNGGKESVFPSLPVDYCSLFDHLYAHDEWMELYGELCTKFINQYGGFHDTLFSEQLHTLCLEKGEFPFYYPKEKLLVFPFSNDYFDSLEKKYPKEVQAKMYGICHSLMMLHECQKFDQTVNDLTTPSLERQYYIQ